jgi:hypothetical protein
MYSRRRAGLDKNLPTVTEITKCHNLKITLLSLPRVHERNAVPKSLYFFKNEFTRETAGKKKHFFPSNRVHEKKAAQKPLYFWTFEFIRRTAAEKSYLFKLLEFMSDKVAEKSLLFY